MTKRNRTQLRKLQDRVIRKLQANGYDWNDKLEGMYHGHTMICLADLRDYLYPAYQSTMESFLN